VRHRKQGRKLGRTSAHRTAMLRNMVCSLFLSEPGEFGTERIITTLEKAKEARRLAERVITLGKKGTLADRRRALALMGNKKEAVSKVFSQIAPRYAERHGGYTRILKLADTRLGDNGSQVVFELVGSEEAPRAGRAPHRKAEAAPEASKPAAKEAKEAQAAEEAPAGDEAGQAEGEK